MVLTNENRRDDTPLAKAHKVARFVSLYAGEEPDPGAAKAARTQAGPVFGVVHWFFLLITFLTSGLGGFLCFINWIAASAVGHQWINRRYVKALEEIEAKHGSAGGTA